MVVISDTSRLVMKREDEVPSCDDYLAWAIEEQEAYRQNELLRRAFAVDPDRAEEILRVAERLAIRRARGRLYGHNKRNGS